MLILPKVGALLDGSSWMVLSGPSFSLLVLASRQQEGYVVSMLLCLFWVV